VKFEDGTPVTAKNIAWGMQRCMDAVNRPGSDGDSCYWISTRDWSVRFVA
jgi:hypothetical protein